ncbi:carbon monoxide dehydrogenase [Novosphingobium sp. AAP83]|uniref:SRPBCC family protein n=1 Tax=Novosphingobium sp. AAP83 TaxID=1523425 RepID=UPI0006B9FD0E|nr:carbon monoxide dehydrogenase subunit G [Novosphingobium sp. AAP83]KPF89324.1 carbon monoxide dehydrogenase [Novosphingobium sp. AAP83]
MKFTGEYRIEAPRETVWAAINNPEILRQCIPGCEEIACNTPTDWTAKVTTRVGPVKARFTGNIRLEDLEPPARCRIVGEGNGGPAGFATGGATVELTEADGATLLVYEADAQIGGKLAQIGSRLIDSFAKRYADEFFAAFARIVAEGETLPAPTAPASTPAPAPSSAPTPSSAPQPVAAAVPQGTAPSYPPNVPAHYPPQPGWRFDSQSFVIVVLALLLVFMTIMVGVK